MIKKLLGIIVLVLVASLSIAGCSSTNNNQAASNTSQAASTTASTSASASASATPKAASTAVPTAAPTIPTATTDAYNVVITGPTTIQPGQGGAWTVIVFKNGVPLANPLGQISWSIDGVAKASTQGYFVTDAMGSETTWAPAGAHTLTATYTGDPSMPSGSITVTSSAPLTQVPTATATL